MSAHELYESSPAVTLHTLLIRVDAASVEPSIFVKAAAPSDVE